MGLQIRRVSTTRIQIVTVIVAGLALVAQPLYGLVSAQVVSAMSADVTVLHIPNSGTQTEVGDIANFTLQLWDAAHDTEPLDSDATVTLESDSASGRFAEGSSSANPWSATPTYTFDGGRASKSLRYKDTSAGSHTITATVKGGGLAHELTATRSFAFIDSTSEAQQGAPVIDILPPVISDVEVSPMTADKIVGGDVTVTFTLSDASGINLSKGTTHVRFTNGKDADGNVVASDTYAVVPVAGEQNRYYATVTTKDFVPNGTVATNFRVYIRAEDTVGKGNQTAATFYKNQITVDNDKPAAEITSPSLMENWGGVDKKTLLIAGTASDDNFTEYRYYVRNSSNEIVGNNGWSKRGTAAVDNGQLGTWDLTGLPSGIYTVGMMVYDKTGNVNKMYDSQKFIVDNDGKPTSTNDLAGVVSGKVTVRQTVIDDYTPASGKLRIWKLDSNGDADNSKFYASGQLPVDENDVVTYSFNAVTDLYGDGDYIAKFTSWDAVGNASVQETRFSVDNTSPIATLRLISSPTPSASTPISLAGTVDDPASLASLKLFVGTQELADLTDDIQGDGSWSYVIAAGLPAGSYDFSVVATDVYGNPSTSVWLTPQLVVGSYVVPPTDLPGRGSGIASITILPTPDLMRPSTLAAAQPVVVPSAAQRDEETQNSSAVLGTETVKSPAEEAGDVPAVAATESGWKFFGVAWYWWLLMAAALAGIIGWFNALRRRKQMA